MENIPALESRSTFPSYRRAMVSIKQCDYFHFFFNSVIHLCESESFAEISHNSYLQFADNTK